MLSYSMNIILSFDLCIVKLVKKPTGRPHPVEDAACPVKLGKEVGRRGKYELTLLINFWKTKESIEECRPFPTPFLLSLLWSKDILT